MDPHVGFLLSRPTIFLEHLTWRFICAGDRSLEKVLNQRLVQRLHVLLAAVDAPVRQRCTLDRYAHLLPFLFLTVQRHGVDVLLVHHIRNGRRRCRTVRDQRGWDLGACKSRVSGLFVAFLTADRLLIDVHETDLRRNDLQFGTDFLPADTLHGAATSWAYLRIRIQVAQKISRWELVIKLFIGSFLLFLAFLLADIAFDDGLGRRFFYRWIRCKLCFVEKVHQRQLLRILVTDMLLFGSRGKDHPLELFDGLSGFCKLLTELGCLAFRGVVLVYEVFDYFVFASIAEIRNAHGVVRPFKTALIIPPKARIS